MVHSALSRVKVGCHEVFWLHTRSFLEHAQGESTFFFFALQKLFARNRRPCGFHSFGGKTCQACVTGCAATTLAGLTAVGHALEGRLFASSQSCVEDHARYLLVVSGFSHYNDIRLGTSTLPADPYSWMIGWATLG